MSLLPSISERLCNDTRVIKLLHFYISLDIKMSPEYYRFRISWILDILYASTIPIRLFNSLLPKTYIGLPFQSLACVPG